MAHAKGITTDTKSGEIATWLKKEFELGQCHATAMTQVIKKGAKTDRIYHPGFTEKVYP